MLKMTAMKKMMMKRKEEGILLGALEELIADGVEEVTFGLEELDGLADVVFGELRAEGLHHLTQRTAVQVSSARRPDDLQHLPIININIFISFMSKKKEKEKEEDIVRIADSRRTDRQELQPGRGEHRRRHGSWRRLVGRSDRSPIAGRFAWCPSFRRRARPGRWRGARE